MPEPDLERARRRLERRRFAVEEPLEAGRQPAAAVLRGPRDPREARRRRGAAGSPSRASAGVARLARGAGCPCAGGSPRGTTRTSVRNALLVDGVGGTAQPSPDPLQSDSPTCRTGRRRARAAPPIAMSFITPARRSRSTPVCIDDTDRSMPSTMRHRGARLVVGEPGPDLAQQVHPLGHRHPVDAREPPPRVVVERRGTPGGTRRAGCRSSSSSATAASISALERRRAAARRC